MYISEFQNVFSRNRQWRRSVEENLVLQRLKNAPRWRYKRHFKDASLNTIAHPRWMDLIGTALEREYRHTGKMHYHDEHRWYWQKIRKRRVKRDYRFELAASEYGFQ